MKILIFGNVASGKTYLAKILKKELFLHFEYLAIDDFRRKIGNGSMVKEIEAKKEFIDSISKNKNQIIEAMGFGDTGSLIFKKIKKFKEAVFVIIINTSIDLCYERIKNRTWDVPYPAPHQKIYNLMKETNKMINQKKIENSWSKLK